MAKPYNGPLPENLLIGDGYTVEFAAIDPVTGAAVAGVKVSNVNITADDQGSTDSGGGGAVVGPFMLVPGPGA